MRASILFRPGRAGSPASRITLLATIALATAVGRVSGQELHPVLNDAASRWVTVDQVEMGAIDIDVSRFVMLRPDVYQIRTRWRFAESQMSREGRRYRSSVAVRAIDCQQRTMALIAFANHDGPEAVTLETQPVYAARWERVNPGTVLDRIATRVCDQVPGPTTRLSSAVP